MSEEYRFLRFEVTGIATATFFLIELFPMLSPNFTSNWLANINVAISIIATLFLISLPLGWFVHQIVVNVYRSSKKERSAFRILDSVLNENNINATSVPEFANPDKKNAFLTILLDITIYSEKTKINSSIEDRLSSRWSHFYARKGIGQYAPIISLIILIAVSIFGYIFSWPMVFQAVNILESIILWVIIQGISLLLINVYSNKLWFEICLLESMIILTNKEYFSKIIAEISPQIIAHPEWIRQTESYRFALLKL